VAALFIGLVAAFRYVSLGSVCAAAALPLTVLLLGYSPWLALAAAAVALIVIARHRANIARLRAGTERRFGEREVAR
jgi:glycerol-3-phosphate acyltransferase PlsY